MKKWLGILSPLFLQTALTSNVPADIMFRSGPVYDEERWNGVRSGNENLLRIYNLYPEGIERLIIWANRESDAPLLDLYPRRYTTPVEKTYAMMTLLVNAEKAYHSREEMIASFSSYLNLNPVRLRFLTMEAAEVVNDIQLQDQANCFVYAFNDPEKCPFNEMVPGFRTSGQSKAPEGFEQNVQDVINKTNSEGARFTGKTLTHRPGFYNVGLYMKPPIKNAQNAYEGIGMHYVRQDRDGKWSHKFSNLNVNRVDFAGNPILDPSKADFNTPIGNYIFIGYFQVPQGGLDVCSPSDSSTKPASAHAFVP